MDDINTYQSNSHCLLISLHLENFTREFKKIIQEHNFIDIKNDERLIQEYLNKLYSTLYSLEYCLKLKDGLIIGLISKYIYEIFIDFQYVFGDSSLKNEKVKDFFDFEQNPEKSDWTKVNRSDRIAAINNSFLITHKNYYSRLNNNAHPSIHSLLLTRRGMEFEQWFIFSSILMDISTIILIINHQETLNYFKYDVKKLEGLSKTNTELLNSLN